MMLISKFEKVLFLILGTLTLLSFSNAENTGKILRANCIVHDPNTIQNVSCWARPFNRTVSVINMKCNVANILRDVKVNVQLYRRKELLFRPFLINVTENYCQFFEKNKGGLYLPMLTKIYLPYTNMNHTCPYFGHVYIKNLPLHSNNIPILWPVGEYRLDVRVIGSEENLITVQLFLEIKEKPLGW